MLKQRIITAAILVPLVLAGVIWLPERIFSFLAAVICLGVAWEWSGLCGCRWLWQRGLLLFIVLCGFVIVDQLHHPAWLLIALLWWCTATVIQVTYPKSRVFIESSQFIPMVMGLLSIVPCWWAITRLRFDLANLPVFIILLLIIWGADVGAYFAGHRFGRRRLLPNVSPGKTWEGFIGGALTVMVIALVASIMMPTLSVWRWLLFSIYRC